MLTVVLEFSDRLADIIQRKVGAGLFQAIEHTGLDDSDIRVLTLYRDTQVIPNPRGSRVLADGDRLLCFGRYESMRGLIPERRKRTRKVRRLPDEPLPPDSQDALEAPADPET